MSHPNFGTPAPNYGDPAYAWSYATDTTGGAGIYGGGGYGGGGYSYGGGSLGGYGLGSGLAAGYPKGGANKRTPALMGFGGMQFIPDGGIALSHAIDDVILRLGHAVYDLMAADECVSACLELLVYSILGGEIHVEPAIVAEPGERMDAATDPQRKKDIEDAKRYADECKRSLERVPEFLDELEAIISEGLIRGSGLGDMSWEVVQEEGDEKPLTLLKSFQCKSSSTWAMVVDKFGQFNGVIGYSWEGPKRFDRDRFFVYQNKRRKGDPRGTSELRCVYDPWNFKIQSRPERGKWIATFANPTALVRYDGNVPPAYPLNADGTEDTSAGPLMPQAQAERVGANIHGASFAAVPIPWELNLVESKNDGGAFSAHEEDCNKSITMGLLLNPRTLNEASHGSRADSESSIGTTLVKVDRKQMACKREIERSIFRTQTELNHGAEAASRLCPRAKFADPDTADIAAQITAWVAAGYKSVPRQLAALDAKFGVPIRSADEIDELQAQEKATQDATVEAMKAKANPPGATAEDQQVQSDPPGKPSPKSKPADKKTATPKPSQAEDK